MKKILVVDDKAENIYLLQSLLEANDFKAFTARNGAEALGLLKVNEPDLIITDILMPVMDGFTLCRECKKDKKLKNIPFFFYTATYTDSKDEEYALGLGADRFILKPQEPDDFIKIVNDFLEELKSKKIKPKENIEQPETVVLKEYNEVLIRKIEDKMVQTEKAEKELRKYAEKLEKEILERKRNEEALQESQLLFQTLAQVSPVGIFRTTADGNTVYVNPKWCELSGLSPEKALGKGWLKAVHPDDRKIVSGKWSTDLHGESKSTAEYRFMKPDGSVVWVLGNAVPEIVNGSVAGYVGTITDITERRLSENKLKSSEERLKILFEYAPDAYYLNDNKGNLVDGNIAAEKLLGFTRNELIGKNFLNLDLLSVKDIPAAAKLLLNNTLGKSTGPDTFTLKRRDGSKVAVEIITHPVTIAGKTLVLGIARDITVRQKAEAALKHSESQLANALKIAQMGAWEYDVLNDIFLFNDLFYAIFRTNAEKIGGYTMSSSEYAGRFVHPEDHSMIGMEIRHALETDDPDYSQQVEHRIVYADGELGYINVRLSIVKDKNGNTIKIYGVNQDITRQKKTEIELIQAKEKAEESDRLKTAFLHNISHEIRTPMNAITGFTALLSEPDIDDSTQKSFIEIITQSSNQLLAIITDIIEISNIEARVINLSKSEVKINSLLKNLYDQFKPIAEGKGLDFTLRTSLPEGRDIIQTDRTKLIQIVSNLLGNAIKFTEKGRIEYGYSISGDQIQFYVSDSGIGIPEDKYDRVFDRFYQVDHLLDRQFEGTGLGLSISKAFVELLGGRIWVESVLNKGSVFYFTLPHESVQVKLSQIHGVDFDITFTRPVTILIAEDNEYNLNLLLKFLTYPNLRVLQAENGREAVKHCESGDKIDLVLMDLRMPEMDGYEATMEIKKIRPDIPVIAQTAFVTEKEKAYSSGCSDILTKPFRKKDLIDILRKYIKE